MFWEEMSNYHKGFTVTCPPDGYYITIIFQLFLLTESTKYLLFIVYFDKVKKIFIFYILIIFVYYISDNTKKRNYIMSLHFCVLRILSDNDRENRKGFEKCTQEK